MTLSDLYDQPHLIGSAWLWLLISLDIYIVFAFMSCKTVIMTCMSLRCLFLIYFDNSSLLSTELTEIDAARNWPCKGGRIPKTWRFDPLTSQTSGLFVAKFTKVVI